MFVKPLCAPVDGTSPTLGEMYGSLEHALVWGRQIPPSKCAVMKPSPAAA